MRLLIAFISCLISFYAFSQTDIPGYTCPTASNYNPDAIEDDDSCVYLEWVQLGQDIIGLYEGAGIAWNHELAINNDGNLDGCSNLEDPLNMLSVYGQCE